MRINQAMKDKVYGVNRNLLNQAQLQNLQILDNQFARQAQAKSNTKAVRQAALSSIARFAGDASLFGSLEARLWLFKGRLIAPGRWGVFGLTDVGRVYLEGESSDEWHASFGGGVFFQMHTLGTVFHAAAAHGDDGTRFYVDYGFAF